MFTVTVSWRVMFSKRSESVHTTAELLSQAAQVVIMASGTSISTTRGDSWRKFKCVVLSRVLLLVLIFEDEVPVQS
jgi:hypothetical protein